LNERVSIDAMRTTVVLAARLRLFVPTAVAALASHTACHGTTQIEPAKQCADPCCSGNASGIDCAQNPNLSCMEDADPCTALAYGCNGGMYYATSPSHVPIGCANDGSAAEVGLVLGDAGGFGSDGGDESGD
jgi:hypothetical protein